MDVFDASNLEELESFAYRPHQLAILKRDQPAGADAFFHKLQKKSFGLAGDVTRITAYDDLHYILEEDMPATLQHEAFYECWLNDMSRIAALFCEVEKSDAIRVWIGSQRGCSRYHIDNVPQRLLVTYAGKGTEWLPDEAADRAAFVNGEPNERIVKDMSARQFIDEWDVAIFRGGSKGLLHRTPDEALHGHSILMRLDNWRFGSNKFKPHRHAEHTA
ncbi:MAG: DUF1826 domain-containing protein [Candidatus Puniceispirillum sp.]